MAIEIDGDYRPSEDEPFMNERQRVYFRKRLNDWKDEILRESAQTLEHLLLIGGAQDLLIEKAYNKSEAEPTLAAGSLFRNENDEQPTAPPRTAAQRAPHLRAVPPEGEIPTDPTFR